MIYPFFHIPYRQAQLRRTSQPHRAASVKDFSAFKAEPDRLGDYLSRPSAGIWYGCWVNVSLINVFCERGDTVQHRTCVKMT
jgi:hypothetical protein